MEISDDEVFKSMQKVAAMEPTVKKVAGLIDNGELDVRIKTAVSAGIKECPFYIEGKAKKKVGGFVKWLLTVIVPIVVTLITVWKVTGFKP